MYRRVWEVLTIVANVRVVLFKDAEEGIQDVFFCLIIIYENIKDIYLVNYRLMPDLHIF